MWSPASAKPLSSGESRPACSATTGRSSPPSSAARAGSPWRSNSASSGPANLRQSRTVPPNPEEVAGRPTRRSHHRSAATPTRPVHQLLQHSTPPPGTRPAHPRPGLRGPTQSVPTGIKIPAHYRVRNDTIDSSGTITLRHNSRLHHIGLGAHRRGTRVTLLVDDLHVRVIGRDTGEPIRELTLDPSRDYQPRGLPPGPPRKKR